MEETQLPIREISNREGVFVSAGTGDYGKLRADLADKFRGMFTIVDQESLSPTGEPTLLKLDTHIRKCGLVFHILGPTPGSKPSLSDIKAFVEARGERGLPSALLDGQATYTHWEAYLALRHKAKLYVCLNRDGEGKTTDPTWSQTEHLECIRDCGGPYPEIEFSTKDELIGEVAVCLLKRKQDEEPSPWTRIDDAYLASWSRPSKEQLLHYFDGGEPDWSHANETLIPMLPLGKTVVDSLLDSRSRSTLHVLNGPTGEGKTTLLLQVARTLALEHDFEVFWLSSTQGSFAIDTCLDMLPPDGRCILVIDQAQRYVERIYDAFEAAKKNRKQVLHVVAAARSTDWIHVRGGEFGWRPLDVTYSEESHTDLDHRSAASIVHAWQACASDDAGLRSLRDTPPDKRADALYASVKQTRSNTGDSLFGGLLAVRFDAPALTDHLRRLINTLAKRDEHRDHPLVEALAIIALIDTIDIAGIDYRIVADVVGCNPRSFESQIQNPLGKEVAVTRSSKSAIWMLSMRHQRIANAAVQVLQAGALLTVRDCLARVVEAAILLGQDRDVDIEGHAAISHMSLILVRKLKPLLDDRFEAFRVARTVAQTALRTGKRLDYLGEYLLVLARNGKSAEAADLAADRLPQLRDYDEDYDDSVRSYFSIWGRAEWEARHSDLAIWLIVYSVSDQLTSRVGGPLELDDVNLGYSLSYLAGCCSPWNGGTFRSFGALALIAHDLSGTKGEQPPDTRCAPPPVDECVQRLSKAATYAGRFAPPDLPGHEQLTFTLFEQAYRRRVVAKYGPILRFIPEKADSDSLYEGFEAYCRNGLPFKPNDEQLKKQLEAVLAITLGDNVVLSAPTGWGKSLVGLGAHFVAFSKGTRSVYTAPTRALVYEKFFALCKLFGSRNVAFMTGDGATENANDALVVCCTAEILQDIALRGGEPANFGWVVMDEFHYYSDERRGMAWQLPLLQMPDTKFVAMSATLGDPEQVCTDIMQRQTGRETTLVRVDKRPVELNPEYSTALIHETVQRCLELDRSPLYVVCFGKPMTKRVAVMLKSLAPPKQNEWDARELRQRIRERLANERFDTPFGKWLRPILLAGIGVHHGGMLPRYRRLVEKLAQDKLVRIVVGTDTLGVGVNLPIRTVIVTQLYKPAGNESTRLLDAREFRQIVGRAGRPGHDDEGYAIVLAPQHIVETKRKQDEAKIKGKKVPPAKRSPPGFIKWDESTFVKLRDANVPRLRSQFRMEAPLLIKLLTRPHGGWAAIRDVIRRAVPRRRRKERKKHITVAAQLARDLSDKSILKRNINRDHEDRLYALTDPLATKSGRPLMLFMEYALAQLDRGDSGLALQILSVVEAVVETKTDRVEAMQATIAKQRVYEAWRNGQQEQSEHEMKTLQSMTDHPAPLREILEREFASWAQDYPWLKTEGPKPRSLVRELYESGLGFREFVSEIDQKLQTCGKRGGPSLAQFHLEEGPVLRHLTEVYKVLKRGLPPPFDRVDEVVELAEWLGVIVRGVDSSLIEEWERLCDPDAAVLDDTSETARDFDVTEHETAFNAMVRTATFRCIQLLAKNNIEDLPTTPDSKGTIAEALAKYWNEHDEIRVDPDARGPRFFDYSTPTEVQQTIVDPAGNHDWILRVVVDLDASREQTRAVVYPRSLEHLGAL